MILLGCLLAFSIAVAPRLVLILAWIFSDRWDLVWRGDVIVPLLGILFLPFTTIMYMLTWTFTSGVEGIDWMWILLGLLLDITKWVQIWNNRKEAATQTQRYYASGAPRSGGVGSTSAAVSSGQVPPSTSPTAADHDTDQTSPSLPPDAPGDDTRRG